MSPLSQKIKADLEQAIRNRDNFKSTVLRSLMAAIRNAEIAQQKTLDDTGIIAVLEKEAKMRRESIEAFQKGNRQDLVSKEKAELDIILGYLPEPMGRDEIVKIARQVIEELGARGPKDKGRVMSQLMPQLRGRASGQEISNIVSELLGTV